MTSEPGDGWLAGDAYEAYMGRWSRPLARRFLAWLQAPPSGHWLDVGCGTGALAAAICDACEPSSVSACDPSAPFVQQARRAVDDRVSFVVAGADDAPRREGGFDAIVSGLVVNFLPDPERTLAGLRDRLRPGGTLAAYVWDYAEGMEFLRVFWDEAVATDPDAAALDEGRRFPLCHRPALAAAFRTAGLQHVEADAIEVPTVFAGFEDYWQPFLRGTGPAPSYVASLEPARRAGLEARLRRRLDAGAGGPIALRARAWTVRGSTS